MKEALHPEHQNHAFRVIMLFLLIMLAVDNLPPAMTTPWGVVYFDEKNPELIAHEQCHLDRMVEIGATAFFSEYFSGGACLEELRCASSSDNAKWILQSHLACTVYPTKGMQR